MCLYHTAMYATIIRNNVLGLYFRANCSRDIETLLSKGTISLSNGKLQQAVEFFSQAVEADPSNYMTHYRRGIAYIAMGKVRSALQDIEKSVELNPGYVLVIFNPRYSLFRLINKWQI